MKGASHKILLKQDMRSGTWCLLFKGPNNSAFHYDIMDHPMVAAEAAPVLAPLLSMITPTW